MAGVPTRAPVQRLPMPVNYEHTAVAANSLGSWIVEHYNSQTKILVSIEALLPDVADVDQFRARNELGAALLQKMRARLQELVGIERVESASQHDV